MEKSASSKSKNTVIGLVILIVLWILMIVFCPWRLGGDPVSPTAIVTLALAEGQGAELTAPTAMPSPIPPTLPPPTATPIPELIITVLHVVQPGETIQTIADQHHTSMPLLAARLRVDELTPGNTIYIPVPNPAACPSLRIHLVEACDTLYGLSQCYHTSVEAIIVANNLSESVIIVGDLLCIP